MSRLYFAHPPSLALLVAARQHLRHTLWRQGAVLLLAVVLAAGLLLGPDPGPAWGAPVLLLIPLLLLRVSVARTDLRALTQPLNPMDTPDELAQLHADAKRSPAGQQYLAALAHLNRPPVGLDRELVRDLWLAHASSATSTYPS